MLKILNGMAPAYMEDLFKRTFEPRVKYRITQNKNRLLQKKFCLYWGKAVECSPKQFKRGAFS